MVCPTNSGNIVEARDQVLIGFFSPLAFIAKIFFLRLSCTYGPFLIDLLICSSCLVYTLNNRLVGILVLLASLITESRLAPRSNRSGHTDGALAFATAVGVVARVHNYAANGRFNAHMSFTSGFTQTYDFVFEIAYLTDSSSASERNVSHFAAGHTKGGFVVFLSHKLSRASRASCYLSAAFGLKFYVVNHRTYGDVGKAQAVAGFDVRAFSA